MKRTLGDVNTQRYWPLGQLILARLREFYREPEAMFWVYGFPILMVVGLGIAFRNQPVQQITVDIEDGPAAASTLEILKPKASDAKKSDDKPAESPGDTTAKSAKETDEKPPVAATQFEARVASADDVRMRLRTGKTSLVVIATAGNPPSYEFKYDPTHPDSLLAKNAVNEALQKAAGRAEVAAVSEVQFTEPGGRYIDFLVPGLLGMGLMGGGLWGIGFVTVDMRIRKLLKRFLATPMRKSDFLAGVMISRLLFMIPEVLVLVVFSRIAFGVVVYGSWFTVALLVVLGAVTFAGLGLLVASRAKTIETVSGLMNLVMLPMWLLSGIFFSSDRFPEAVQPFIKVLPLTALINALRAVMQEGSTLASQLPQIGLLAGWAVVSFVLALKWFRWM